MSRAAPLPTVLAWIHLSPVLHDQLTAINQYFLHAGMFKKRGLKRLNKADYRTPSLSVRMWNSMIDTLGREHSLQSHI
ncbi:hypothetical protein Tel_07700 [Candidatus Tenderia electrophaga]|uniref:Uncharacterized protein n=1 Tax=Candidatus Tenderia electrophaga TaxID=1748243 RepID=A0A0S2TD19_9GAMM|nr:hypothetical protein Tel_07700 [Candidatus Tenderia electrophaga]